MNAAVWFSSLAGLAALAATPAEAQPSRVIILRHAEKLNAYALCGLGGERANALQTISRPRRDTVTVRARRAAGSLHGRHPASAGNDHPGRPDLGPSGHRLFGGPK